MIALVLSGDVSADLSVRRGALAHRPPDVLATPKSTADRPVQRKLFTCEDVSGPRWKDVVRLRAPQQHKSVNHIPPRTRDPGVQNS